MRLKVAIYEWHAWKGFLLPTMFAGATRIRAHIGESAADVERRLPPAPTLFCFHLDLTFTSNLPIERRALVDRLKERGDIVVNGSLTDISKRHIQSCCRAAGLPTTDAVRDGDPDELVMVKTDLNYGGHTERGLKRAERRLLNLPHAPGTYRRTSRTYRITPRRKVTAEEWERGDLFIERFIRNAAGLFFRVHIFFDRAVVSAGRVKEPIKELHWGTPRQDFYFAGDAAGPSVPQAYDLSAYCRRSYVARNLARVRQFCRQIGLEFGTIDVVVNDQRRWHVVDANATPFWNRPDREDIVHFLAGGPPMGSNSD